jgi:hypothetical protein
MKSLTGMHFHFRQFAFGCGAFRCAAATPKVPAESDVPVTVSRFEVPRHALAAASNRRPRPPLTRLGPSHISAKPGQWRGRVIWLRFWLLNLGLLNSHSFGGCSRIGACSAMRHDELIGNRVNHVMAATPNRKDRKLA